MKRLAYIFVASLLIFMSCESGKNDFSHKDNPSYCEDSAMAHFITQPERSMTLLDSAVLLNRLTPQRAQYLKAIVTYNGLRKPDSCIAICQKMVDDKSWTELPDSDDQVSFQVDLYELMATAAYTISDYNGIQRYCKAGLELTHGRKDLLSEDANMTSRMGAAMVALGETAKGLKSLSEATSIVEKDDKWSSVLTYLNISKKYVCAYLFTEDYKGACRVVKETLSRLGQIRNNHKKIKGIPSAMLNDSSALAEFIEYYEAPLSAFISKAYAKQGMLDSSKVWYARFMANPQHDNPSQASAIIFPLISFGNYDEALRQIESTKDFISNDTLSSDYIELLEYEQDIYSKTGRKDEAIALSQRIHALTKAANKKEYMSLLANSTMQSELQYEQLKRKDAEEKSLTMTIIAIAALSLMLISLAIHYIYRLRRKHSRLSSELEKANSKIKELNESRKEPEQIEIRTKAVSPEEIYRRATIVMDNEKPFVDPKYTIEDLARQTFTNRAYLSSSINQLSGMTFRNWLAKYRVEYAKSILRETPDISITQLSKKCGFDGRNSLYRQFSNIEGITLADWVVDMKNEE